MKAENLCRKAPNADFQFDFTMSRLRLKTSVSLRVNAVEGLLSAWKQDAPRRPPRQGGKPRRRETEAGSTHCYVVGQSELSSAPDGGIGGHRMFFAAFPGIPGPPVCPLESYVMYLSFWFH